MLDLSPAHWIWLPCQRTLQNTLVLLRREFTLEIIPQSAVGWILADSRYRLFVNGVRVQWGPAPCDPRDQEADPLDLTRYLVVGRNVLAIEVLFYGTGDGTWALGSPGVLLRLDLTQAHGGSTTLVSDASWRCHIDRAWMPGRYKRWYLRALQEIVDSRLHPLGWQQAGFDDAGWMAAAELPGRADRPSLCAGARDYLYDAGLAADSPTADSPALVEPRLRQRTIPLLDESQVMTAQPMEAGSIIWHRPADDWFEFRITGALTATRHALPTVHPDGGWLLPATSETNGSFVTFALPAQSLGWPQIEIDAPAGAIIELITQESHDPVNGPAWLDTYWHCWSRLTTRGGRQEFEAFDYECCRWIQVHIRSPHGPVHLRRVGLRLRRFPWPHTPQLQCAEPALQRLFTACIQTLHNSAHDQICDGSGRERQQYAGDCGNQLSPLRLLFGDESLAARYLRTWSEGQTTEGYFLDCWPAYDRLNRLAQRQLGITNWGPILDHGIGYVFDHHLHWMETGDLDASREAWPRLKRQMGYLGHLVRSDGLLPVEDLGVPSVWIDHISFQQQRHKRCAFNLYVTAMLRHAMAPLAEAFAEPETAEQARAFADRLHEATVRTFWDPTLHLYIDNRPWLADETAPRTCDRALSTAILWDLVPGGETNAIRDELATMPERCGWSYPANAGYRLAALARLDRADVIVHDLRTRWATMASVIANGTLQEDWVAKPDSTQEWSHCPLAPANTVIHDLFGLHATSPGFMRWSLRPRLANLDDCALTVHTVAGTFTLANHRTELVQHLTVSVPSSAGPGVIILADGTHLQVAPGALVSLTLP